MLLVSVEILIPDILSHLTCAASEFVQSRLRAMLWALLLGLPAPPKTLGVLWTLGRRRGHSRTSKSQYSPQRCAFILPGSQSVVPRPAASVFKCVFLAFEKWSDSLQPHGPLGSSVCGILQAKYWSGLPCPFLDLPRPRDQTWVSCISGRFFTV